MNILTNIRKFITKHRRYGKIYLISTNGMPLTVTREVYYHLNGGHTELDFYSYDDIAEFCKKQNCKTITGNTL